MPVRIVDELAKVDREALRLLADAKIAGQKIDQPTLWQVSPDAILFTLGEKPNRRPFTGWKGEMPVRVVRVDQGFVAEF